MGQMQNTGATSNGIFSRYPHIATLRIFLSGTLKKDVDDSPQIDQNAIPRTWTKADLCGGKADCFVETVVWTPDNIRYFDPASRAEADFGLNLPSMPLLRASSV